MLTFIKLKYQCIIDIYTLAVLRFRSRESKFYLMIFAHLSNFVQCGFVVVGDSVMSNNIKPLSVIDLSNTKTIFVTRLAVPMNSAFKQTNYSTL